MSFQKIKKNSYCVGGRHRSATKNIYGDITSKVSEILIDISSYCNRKKSMTVSRIVELSKVDMETNSLEANEKFVDTTKKQNIYFKINIYFFNCH